MIPHFLINKIKAEYNDDYSKKIIEGYFVDRKTTFRVNTLKTSQENIEKFLCDNNINFEKCNYIKNAYRLENDINIENLSIYKNGEIYVQSISSMLPPIFLEPEENTDILDMTAAPGGKTTQIAAITNNKANITACEMNSIRAEKLKYNIEKQGATSVYIMRTDSRRINNLFSFDKILLDAPCSGSGTVNIKDNNIEKYFTEDLIKKSIKIQKELLNKAIKILKHGHDMIYSTCSILKEENEDVIEEVLKNNNAEIVPIEMNNLPLLPTKTNGTICIYPTELFEGFFVAKIRKK